MINKVCEIIRDAILLLTFGGGTKGQTIAQRKYRPSQTEQKTGTGGDQNHV